MSHLQTVIDGKESRRALHKCPNSTDLDWTRASAHDGRDPRSWPQTRPCRGLHVLEQSCTAYQHGAWISCARCALRLHYVPRHTARMTSVSTPSTVSVQEALKRMSLLRDMIAEVEGRKPRKKKDPPLTSSAAGKCSDDGIGFVEKLSGRLARKLQRSASLVNAGLSKQIQSALDAAVVDRCDFVEICSSDAPCLTEAMQQRGISSSSLLRSDGVGNCNAQTREKLLGWFPEKRPRKAWFSPPVIEHQNNSTRCSLQTRQIFRKFFEYAAAVLPFGGHIYWNVLQTVPAGLLSSWVILELWRKVVVENCL